MPKKIIVSGVGCCLVDLLFKAVHNYQAVHVVEHVYQNSLESQALSVQRVNACGWMIW